MTAFTIEQYGRYQTSLKGSHLFRSSVRYNPILKQIKRINEGLVLKRNDARIRAKELAILRPSLGTAIDSGKKMPKIHTTQGTGYLDFWPDGVSLSDYSALIDDYDVAAVEEIHMQSASNYGW